MKKDKKFGSVLFNILLI